MYNDNLIYNFNVEDAIKLHYIVIDNNIFNLDCDLKHYLELTFYNYKSINKDYYEYFKSNIKDIPKQIVYNILNNIINNLTLVNLIYIDYSIYLNLDIRNNKIIILTNNNNFRYFDYSLYNYKITNKSFFSKTSIVISWLLLIVSMIFFCLYQTHPINIARNNFINNNLSKPIEINDTSGLKEYISPILTINNIRMIPMKQQYMNVMVSDYSYTYQNESLPGSPINFKLEDGVIYSNKYINSLCDYTLNRYNEGLFYKSIDIYNKENVEIGSIYNSLINPKVRTKVIYNSDTYNTNNIYLNKNTFNFIAGDIISKMVVNINNKEVEIINLDNALYQVVMLYHMNKINYLNEYSKPSLPPLYNNIVDEFGNYNIPSIESTKSYIFTNDLSIAFNDTIMFRKDELTFKLSDYKYGYVDFVAKGINNLDNENKLPQVFLNDILYKELFNELNYSDYIMNNCTDNYHIIPNASIEEIIDNKYIKQNIFDFNNKINAFNEDLNNARIFEYLLLSLVFMSFLSFVIYEIKYLKKRILYNSYNVIYSDKAVIRYLVDFAIVTITLILIFFI